MAVWNSEAGGTGGAASLRGVGLSGLTAYASTVVAGGDTNMLSPAGIATITVAGPVGADSCSVGEVTMGSVTAAAAAVVEGGGGGDSDDVAADGVRAGLATGGAVALPNGCTPSGSSMGSADVVAASGCTGCVPSSAMTRERAQGKVHYAVPTTFFTVTGIKFGIVTHQQHHCPGSRTWSSSMQRSNSPFRRVLPPGASMVSPADGRGSQCWCGAQGRSRWSWAIARSAALCASIGYQVPV